MNNSLLTSSFLSCLFSSSASCSSLSPLVFLLLLFFCLSACLSCLYSNMAFPSPLYLINFLH